MFSRERNKTVRFILGFLLVSNVFAWLAVYDLNRNRFFETVFFDIGQGDSIFIKTPQRRQILVDGGPGSLILEKLAKEMPFYDRTIDLVILTHPEHDHYFGLFEVLEKYKVKNILWTGVVRDTAEYSRWLRLIKEEGARIRIARAGQRIIIQQEPLIFIEILHPFENLLGKKVERTNDTSIVFRLSFSNVSFLFTDDISQKKELELIRQNKNLKADILKVAHHGSKTSTSSQFLEKSLPKTAVIQVGKNNHYGHPHSEVLARLKEFGIEVLRTDLNGDVKIISDGNNFNIKMEKSNIKDTN